MAAAKKNKKMVALRKGRQRRPRNALTRRRKTSRPKRKVVVVKFPKRNYLATRSLMPSFFNRRMRAHRFVAKKGKHPTRGGQRKMTMRMASRAGASRLRNRKGPMRMASWKTSLRSAAARKKSLRVTRKVPMKGGKKKKLLRATRQKGGPRSHKAKKSYNSRATSRKALQITLKEVAKKKKAKWVITGAKRRRGAGKDREVSNEGAHAKQDQVPGSSHDASGLTKSTANSYPNVAS